MIYFDLILISVICVMIIDVSGFIGEMEGILGKWLDVQAHIPKPFSCSMCMTHWIGLIYLLINGISLLNYTILLIIACSTPLILGLWHVAMNLVSKLIKIMNL